MMMKLNDTLSIVMENDRLIFYNEIKRITIKRNEIIDEYIKNLINYKKCEVDNIEDKSISNMIKILMEEKMLIREKNVDNNINKCNVLYLNNFIQNADKQLIEVSKKLIVIIGLGGVGQVVLQHLVAGGFRKFVIVDYDIVCEKNLNRQFLLQKNQKGMYKVDAIKKNITKLENNLKIYLSHAKIQDTEDMSMLFEDFETPSMIVCAADYPPNTIKKLVVLQSIKLNVPCAFAAVGLTIGEMGPLLTEEEAKLRYLKKLEEKEKIMDKMIYSPVLSSSICFTNTLISTLFAKDIFEYFLGNDIPKSLNALILYNLSNMEILKKLDYQ